MTFEDMDRAELVRIADDLQLDMPKNATLPRLIAALEEHHRGIVAATAAGAAVDRANSAAKARLEGRH